MIIEIPDVLDAQTLTQMRAQIAASEFVDGRGSAGASAQRVKHNRELPAARAAELAQRLLGPLHAHPVFQAAALPLRLSAPTVARYGPGMAYGPHTDDPVMGPPGGQRYRCDIAITLMLSDPASFDGGDLVVQTAFGEQRARPAAGTAVIYPASTLHEVSEVRAGERLVAVAWAQSMVRSSEQRQVLFDLWRVRDTLATGLPDASVTAQTDRIYTNLVRMWSQV